VLKWLFNVVLFVELMSYLRYLRIVVSNRYCVAFVCCLSSSCATHPMLPVSLDCHFFYFSIRYSLTFFLT
jgi:hypothetical protein